MPAVLVAMILGIAASVMFGLADRGVPVVGQIPASLARPHMPAVTRQDLWLLLAAAFGGHGTFRQIDAAHRWLYATFQ